MDTKAIEAKLNTADGWKGLHGGGLFGGKAKKSLAAWQTASEKGVSSLYTLRRDEYGERFYAIYAFSTKGKLTDPEVAQLSKAVSDIPLGTIRYESKGSTSFCAMHLFKPNPDNELSTKFNEISIKLSDPAKGIFVIVESSGDKARLDASSIAWGLAGYLMNTYTIQDAK